MRPLQLRREENIEAKPTKVRRIADAKSTVSTPPTHRFVLTWRPAHWDVFEDIGEILPTLRKLYSEEGVHGIAKGQDILSLESNISNKLNCRFIHESDIGEDYNIQYPTTSGGFVYLTPWETPRANDANTPYSLNIEKYKSVIYKLLDDNVVEMPTSEQVERRLDELLRARDELADSTRHQQDVSKLDKKIAVLRKYLPEAL